jgi:hypothetical protein
MDDTELIRVAGIGHARARWFEETFGVRTLPELAALDAAQIEDRLRATQPRGVLPARSQIERWIVDAEQLGEQWRAVASFVLEVEARDDGESTDPSMRTIAHHVEGDRTQTFDGLAPPQLRAWITDRLQPPPPPRHAGATPPPGVTELHLKASVGDAAGGPPLNVIRSTDPWVVSCAWYIDGPAAGSLAGRWRVELLAEGQGPAAELDLPAAGLIEVDGRTGPSHPYVFTFYLSSGAVDLLGRPQAVLDLTIALTYIDVASTPGPIAAFVDLDKVVIFRSA